MTRETKEELLLTMLFFGFLLLSTVLSLEIVCDRATFPSPNAGTEDLVLVIEPFSLAVSERTWTPPSTSFTSFSSLTLLLSCLPSVLHRKRLLVVVGALFNGGRTCRGFKVSTDSFTPLVGGLAEVARGFGFVTGVSEGCGGGVAN